MPSSLSANLPQSFDDASGALLREQAIHEQSPVTVDPTPTLHIMDPSKRNAQALSSMLQYHFNGCFSANEPSDRVDDICDSLSSHFTAVVTAGAVTAQQDENDLSAVAQNEMAIEEQSAALVCSARVPLSITIVPMCIPPTDSPRSALPKTCQL